MHYKNFLLFACSFAVLTVLAPATATQDLIESHKDGAPAGHTGGFGEKTCRTCHFDGELNDQSGWARLEGVPQSYLPDSTYLISISVGRPKLGRAGFLLSARFDDGSAAGSLMPIDSLVKLVLGDSHVPFATHTSAGNRVESDSASWSIVWRAPPRISKLVSFSLAANAANGDDSEFGDQIYAVEQISRPASQPTRGE